MNISFRQMRAFSAVARAGSFTAAAKQVNLTQSAVSAAVSTIETRYGVKLFDRVGRRIELTESGRLFLTEARAVLAAEALRLKTKAQIWGSDFVAREENGRLIYEEGGRVLDLPRPRLMGTHQITHQQQKSRSCCLLCC